MKELERLRAEWEQAAAVELKAEIEWEKTRVAAKKSDKARANAYTLYGDAQEKTSRARVAWVAEAEREAAR